MVQQFNANDSGICNGWVPDLSKSGKHPEKVELTESQLRVVGFFALLAQISAEDPNANQTGVPSSTTHPDERRQARKLRLPTRKDRG